MRPVTVWMRPVVATMFLLGPIMLTPGCAESPNIPGMTGQALPADPGDPCQQERATFATSNSFFTANILQSAGAAALLGAETPFRSSFNSSTFSIATLHQAYRDTLAAAAKSLFGSAEALVTQSYSEYVTQQSNGDRSQVADRVGSDLAVEGQARDKTIANFTALRDCRFRQAAIIKRQARDHTITRSAAQDSPDQEHTWFDQEIALATKWGVNMQRRDEQFAAAAEMVAPDQPEPPAHRAVGHRRVRHGGTDRGIVVAATETIPDKREALVGTISQAKAESATAFNEEPDDQSLNRFRLLHHASDVHYA